MKTIHKFELLLKARNIIQMPKDASILTVQTQKDTLQIWAIVNTISKKEDRVFEIAGTGIELISLPAGQKRTYIATTQIAGFVWHIFEIV